MWKNSKQTSKFWFCSRFLQTSWGSLQTPRFKKCEKGTLDWKNPKALQVVGAISGYLLGARLRGCATTHDSTKDSQKFVEKTSKKGSQKKACLESAALTPKLLRCKSDVCQVLSPPQLSRPPSPRQPRTCASRSATAIELGSGGASSRHRLHALTLEQVMTRRNMSIVRT